MADNSAAKSHLNSVESKLNNVNDLNGLSTIITQTSLNLENVLGAGKNLFIDSDIKSYVDSIVTRLESGLKNDFHPIFQSIAGSYTAAPAGKKGVPIKTDMTNKWNDLVSKHIVVNDGTINAAGSTKNSTQTNNRLTEYKEIKNYIDSFRTFNPGSLNIDITRPTGVINVSGWFSPIAGFTPTTLPSYELCDADGKSIKSGSSYKVKIGGTEYTLTGITSPTPTNPEFDFAGLSIYPPITNLPQTIDLSINAVCKGVTRGINVIDNKKFKLIIDDGTIKVDTEATRETAFQDYEDSGGRHAISQQLDTKINVRHSDPEVGKNVLERKAVEAALKYKGGTKYDALTEKQKRLFYERIYRLGFFDPVYIAGGVIDAGNARYDKMKNRFTRDGRPRNNDKNIICSAGAYKTFIHSHLDEKCNEYILTTLVNYLQEDALNTKLKSELSKFLQEIDQNKIDDDSVNTKIHRELKRKKYKMNRGPRSLFHPRDVNYMRFFSNSSASLKRQQVNIYSNIDNPEPVNYDMNVNITGKNSIEVEIKIDGTDEVIKQKSGQPSTLIRKIMRDQRIKHGKVRAHIGFNIYKSIIQIAQQRDISLTYRGVKGKKKGFRSSKSGETRKIQIDKKGNIVVKQIDHLTTSDTEKDIFVFDQNSFLNVNEFDIGQTNGRLREGLETLGYHFNLAMNDFHKQYRNGTERRVGGLIHSKNRMTLPTSFWLSPIKKILNFKTNTNFDFDTSVNSQGKNIGINFHKNKFTIEMDGLKKPISSRDLGKLLNHREGKVRVFDGVERDIVEGVYSSLIDALRKNAKIARTSFGVVDDITGNMYILDEDGKFGVIAKEDFKGKNKIKNPFRGRFRGLKKKGTLKKSRLDDVSWRPLEPKEQKELLKNPFLMQKFVKAMNNRMGLWGSITALFN